MCDKGRFRQRENEIETFFKICRGIGIPKICINKTH